MHIPERIRKVIWFMSEGKTRRQIGKELNIKESTLNIYISHAMAHFSVNKDELVGKFMVKKLMDIGEIKNGNE